MKSKSTFQKLLHMLTKWCWYFLHEGWSTLEDILITTESLCSRIYYQTIEVLLPLHPIICQWTTADRKRENLEKNKNPKKTIWCGSTKFQRNFCKYVLPACCRTFKTTKVMSLHPLTYWHWNFPNLERTSEMYFPFAWCIVALLGIDQDADSSNSLMHSFLHFEHISFIYSFFSLMHPFLHFEHISFIHSFFSFIHGKNILFMHSILHPYWTHLIYAFRSSFIVNTSYLCIPFFIHSEQITFWSDGTPIIQHKGRHSNLNFQQTNFLEWLGPIHSRGAICNI